MPGQGKGACRTSGGAIIVRAVPSGTPLPLALRRVNDPHDLAAIFRLRVAAWRARVPHFPAMEAWSDGFDAIAEHWAVFDDGKPVAAARLTIHGALADVPSPEVFAPLVPAGLEGPIAVLTRLVVAPSHARRGLSRQLDEVRIDRAREAGCRHVVGSTYAGQPRIKALQALGFEPLGEAGLYASGPLREVALGGAGGRRETGLLLSL